MSGFTFKLVPFVALARARAALDSSWDTNGPKCTGRPGYDARQGKHNPFRPRNRCPGGQESKAGPPQ